MGASWLMRMGVGLAGREEGDEEGRGIDERMGLGWKERIGLSNGKGERWEGWLPESLVFAQGGPDARFDCVEGVGIGFRESGALCITVGLGLGVFRLSVPRAGPKYPKGGYTLRRRVRAALASLRRLL